MTESPKPPPRPVPRPGAPDAANRPVASSDPTPGKRDVGQPPPPPIRSAQTLLGLPIPAAPPTTAPPAASATPLAGATQPLTRDPARDTLAPSSFGVLGLARTSASAGGSAATALPPLRGARGPLPTLGELESAPATATLRPPGAVPPPPRGLPAPLPVFDAGAFEAASPVDTPLPSAPTSPRASAVRSATLLSQATEERSLDSTLDVGNSASKRTEQAHLLEKTRISATDDETRAVDDVGRSAAPLGVPAPGLFIADEPLEPGPRLSTMVSVERTELSRMRVGLVALGGVSLLLAVTVGSLLLRRSDTNSSVPALSVSTSSASLPPGCTLALPPARLSPSIERSVPIAALALSSGNIALGIADTKTSAAGFIYNPDTAEPVSRLTAPPGTGQISYVTPSEPTLTVDRAGTDFAFARSLAPGLSLGVGPSGVMRRGNDDGSGVVWAVPTGIKVTPPRAAAVAEGYFVAFRQGGAEGQLTSGWLGSDGTARGPLAIIPGTPASLGTPSVSTGPKEGLVVFPGRTQKAEPFRIYAARAAVGQPAGPAVALNLPADGGGAIAPALAALPGGRFLVQWTDGKVGQYRVHVHVLDANLAPLGDALLVSAKGANAGQGTLVAAGKSVVSFFIQTTAGHDELWGASLTCH